MDPGRLGARVGVGKGVVRAETETPKASSMAGNRDAISL